MDAEERSDVKEKLTGYEFYEKVLKRAKYICAPMVDASELAFRTLVRNYNVQLTYTPMLHARLFVSDKKYRAENLTTSEFDRPLIVQFCANDPEIFVAAAKLAAPYCDAIDLNLGCPQNIAKRGNYGAFLQDNWPLIEQLVSSVANQVDVPITCKVRIFEDVKKSIEYAQMLERAGCSLLTVHGRIRSQKGILTGLADWNHIKAVKESVRIPVFANGNIQSLTDVENCLALTGVDGIMSAEGLLHNPALFSGRQHSITDISREYLKLSREFPCPLSFARGHLFKILHHALLLDENFDLRMKLAKGRSFEEFEEVIKSLEDKYGPEQGEQFALEQSTLPVPIYCCQPYFRPLDRPQNPEKVDTSEGSEVQSVNPVRTGKKRKQQEEGENSRTEVKKKVKPVLELCTNNCKNCKSAKCDHNLCKPCCKSFTLSKQLDCQGHRYMFAKRKELNSSAPVSLQVN